MDQHLWRRFDYLLLLSVLALVAYGLILIYSATLPPVGQEVRLDASSPVVKQASLALIGLIILVVTSLFDYRFLGESWLFPERPDGGKILSRRDELLAPWRRAWRSFIHPLYLINIGFLIVVLRLGTSRLGGMRWIDLKVFEFQPSELAKVLVILTLAKLLADQGPDVRRLSVFFLSLAHVAIPVILIRAQPDLGTALVLLAIWLAMVTIAGTRLLYLIAMAGAGLAVTPLIWLYVLQPYQRDRLLAFINPYRDPLGEGYNLIQSLIGIGSGGLLGKGLTAGTQSQHHFLRVQHTDYIFAVLGEELGFVGAALLLLLFLFLLFRALRVAESTRDPFGQLIVVGVVTMILFQVVVNVGMNSGLLPVTGIPLPFISYGRSSLLSLFIALGLVESVAIWRQKPEY